MVEPHPSSPALHAVNNQVGRGQGFRATCKAIKGTARQHAKWSPVALCVFRQEPLIELNKERLASMSASEKQE